MTDLATIFAWFVMALLFFVFVTLVVFLGSLPKKIALKRKPSAGRRDQRCELDWPGLRRDWLAHRICVGLSTIWQRES
jgi:hypothetical protein